MVWTTAILSPKKSNEAAKVFVIVAVLSLPSATANLFINIFHLVQPQKGAKRPDAGVNFTTRSLQKQETITFFHINWHNETKFSLALPQNINFVSL